MTSSADTREALPAPTPARTTPRPAGKRVAGSRRRPAGPLGEGRTPRPAPTQTQSLTQAPDRVAERTPEQTRGQNGRDGGAAPAEVAGPEDAAPRPTRWWPSVVATVLALGLLAAALVASTRPVLAQGETDAAVGSARTSLERLLSYSGAEFDAHVTEVTPHLASPFKEEFTKVAATDIKPMAVKNGATVLAKVYEAGVMDTTGTGGAGTTVRVLAFVNQATTTKAQTTPAIDQNRVIATMTKVGDRWLISRLEAF